MSVSGITDRGQCPQNLPTLEFPFFVQNNKLFTNNSTLFNYRELERIL